MGICSSGTRRHFFSWETWNRNMHTKQLRRQLQLVSHFTSLLQNFEWPDKPHCELASYLESAQTPHRWYLEVYNISNFKAQFSPPMVGIALLSWLRNSQVLSHHTNLLLGLFNMSGQKTFHSPVSLQNNGVCHLQPYSISNDTIFRLSW
jgi:hypothetical protein